MRFTVIGQEIDKLGDTLIIKHSEHLAFSPAYTSFVRHMMQLIDSDHHSACTVWDDGSCAILWAELNGKIVGIFCYETTYTTASIPFLAIQLTAVEPEYRQRGIHKIMNKYFEQMAIKLGCVAIRATVNVRNRVRLVSAEKDKLVPLIGIMTKVIQ
jgi:GNAT superfamily N-acetyltransferase